jgi:RimJ/RimL family protein N-acetyltransferase
LAEYRVNWQDIHIETERLILRPPREEDFDGFAGLMDDDVTAGFIGGAQSRPVAWRSFLTLAGAWTIQGFGMFSVIENSSGEWLGRVGPWYPEGWPGTEVGWGMRRAAWGKGYATEAAMASIDFAFQSLGWSEVVHTIHPDNAPSKKLAARVGARYRRDCRLPEPFADEPAELWGQTQAEWQERRP